jgi:hypothetical protein
MYRDLMIPGEILCGRHHRVCRVTNWETFGKMGNALQGKGYPRTFYKRVVWVGVLGLVCECVCDC